MSALTETPPNYGFGLDFNYALWTQGTVVTMVNVPWNNDYRDIVKFTDRNSLNAYIDSIENVGVKISNLSYVKPNQPIRIDVPINAAYKFNYLRARNPLQPVNGDVARDYYYFVTDVRYVAPQTTEIVVQLDVWQTFGFDATFGNCYIDRGHIGIANENAFDNFGRNYLTIPEGIDVGSEYQVITKSTKSIMASHVGDDPNAAVYDILVVSSVDIQADPGTSASPILVSAQGGNYFGLPSGANYYIFSGKTNDFMNIMQSLSDKPWITQGILSITVIPPIARYMPDYVYGGTGAPYNAPDASLNPRKYPIFSGWRDSPLITDYIPDRYKKLKKLLTFPYMVVELTTFTGTPIIIKPESWADADATVVERISPLPPNQRVTITPYKYNAVLGSSTDGLYPNIDAIDPTQSDTGDDHGDYIDFSTQISNFPTLAIVNNMAIGYLASNAHGIAFQNRSAGWQQQRALNSNQVSYDQQSAGIATSQNINALQRAGMASHVANDQMALLSGVAANGLAGLISGGIGSAMGGGVSPAIGGATNLVMSNINAGISIEQSNRNLATTQMVSKGSNAGENRQAALLRDTNKSLADWAARGDYENTIAGINAKVQDSHLTQPTTSGQVGGEAINLLNNNCVVSARFKMIDQASIRVVGEYWLRYGYAVRQFAQMPANYMVMSKFTYWKLSETYIVSSQMPESFKQVIRGIFEKGVTVWADPSYIGVTDIADNVPLEGITL